jgi:hypothetical protein
MTRDTKEGYLNQREALEEGPVNRNVPTSVIVPTNTCPAVVRPIHIVFLFKFSLSPERDLVEGLIASKLFTLFIWLSDGSDRPSTLMVEHFRIPPYLHFLTTNHVKLPTKRSPETTTKKKKRMVRTGFSLTWIQSPFCISSIHHR